LSQRVSARVIILFMLLGILVPVSCTAISAGLTARKLEGEFAVAEAYRALEVLMSLQDEHRRDTGSYANGTDQWSDIWAPTSVPTILAATADGYIGTVVDESDASCEVAVGEMASRADLDGRIRCTAL
jgi:hypothetical protein